MEKQDMRCCMAIEINVEETEEERNTIIRGKSEMERGQEAAVQMEQAFERFGEMMEELRPALEAMWEAILEIVYIIVETIKRICRALWRGRLYIQLLHWHFPHRVAAFIANRWPARWLPAMA